MLAGNCAALDSIHAFGHYTGASCVQILNSLFLWIAHNVFFHFGDNAEYAACCTGEMWGWLSYKLNWVEECFLC